MYPYEYTTVYYACYPILRVIAHMCFYWCTLGVYSVVACHSCSVCAYSTQRKAVLLITSAVITEAAAMWMNKDIPRYLQDRMRERPTLDDRS